MTREKFPEKIPFRLTRMLIKAMEVTGIDGTYRRTCESVMSVLRRNKDSLMAVLEAFVYDPLLNWRLLDTTDKLHRSKANDGIGSSENSLNDEAIYSLIMNTTNHQSCRRKSMKSVRVAATTTCTVHNPNEVTNKKARQIVDRVKQKLSGNDFNTKDEITVQRQVDLLIQQATNNENLCQCYMGWCPFW